MLWSFSDQARIVCHCKWRFIRSHRIFFIFWNDMFRTRRKIWWCWRRLLLLRMTLHVWRGSIITVIFRVSQNFAWCSWQAQYIWWCCSVTFPGKRNIWWSCSVYFFVTSATSGDAGVWLLMARAISWCWKVIFRNQGNVWWLVDSRSAKHCNFPYKMGEN